MLKAISLLGLGKAIIEWVDVDEQGRILTDQLPALDAKTIVILQAGNVNSGALSEARDGMFYTPDMSRRARIVELWAALKYLGRTGVEALVYGLHIRAVQFAKELTNAGFIILNDVVFNQVLVCCESDEATSQVLAQVQASGECWCGGSV